jgi:DNA adenine methylase
LADLLKSLPCDFILSTWHSNEFRTNGLIEQNWQEARFHVLLREHYYHVGSTENLRHPMIEALIANFPVHAPRSKVEEMEQLAFFERPVAVL